MLPKSGEMSRVAVIPAAAGIEELRSLIRHTREMVRQIGTAREAAVMVRRASATSSMIGEALKACQVLEADQFALRHEAADALLRTQRRAGELIREIELNPGGRPRKTASTQAEVLPRRPTLSELGITAHDSLRWRQIAAVASAAFEEYLQRCLVERRELTGSGLLAYARRVAGDRADPDAVDGRFPSAPPAQYAAYIRADRTLRSLLWLDPSLVAAAVEVAAKDQLLDSLDRYLAWFTDLRQAIEPS